MASASRPTILLISISDHGFLEEMYASLFDQLSQSTTLKSAKAASDAIQALNEGNLKAVIITDEGLTARANKKVLDKVKTYVQNGGLAIVGLHFNSFTTGDAFDRFFAAFELPWKRGDYCRTSFNLNPECALPPTAAAASFPDWLNMKAVHVAHVRADEKIFIGVSSWSEEAGVAATQVGSGCLAYVGDVNAEAESNKVILALCGL